MVKGKRTGNGGKEGRRKMAGKEEMGKVEEGSGPLVCQNVAAPLGQKLGVSGHRGHQWIDSPVT